MEHIFRLLDYNVYNAYDSSMDNDDTENTFRDTNGFMIQMFGVDEIGKTYSVTVEGFKPFFYVMVNDKWTIEMKEQFIVHLKEKMGKFYSNSITDSKLIKRKKLYGFDNKKEHKFIHIQFANLAAFNKAKNLWYSDYQSGHVLLKNGYRYFDTDILLYEANVLPLLRFFHIKDISPSGWIAIPKKKAVERKGDLKAVNCDYEFVTNEKYIIPLNDKETRVPYKIMSFDIEASSSHGDFPVPIKTYKKLATNIVEYFENVGVDKFNKLNRDTIRPILENIILTAFGHNDTPEIDVVYPKKQINVESLMDLCNKWLDCKVKSLKKSDEFIQANNIETMFERMAKEQKEEDNEEANDDLNETKDGLNESGLNDQRDEVTKIHTTYIKEYTNKTATIADILLDNKFEREGKLNELNISLDAIFPKLEGDKVTFIGSTFMNYGNKDPHFNHCIALNSCSSSAFEENTVIESYNTEKEVLLAWQQLVQKENPDIIIGYNIFGFDYAFMFRRSEETGCVEEFLKLGRNKDDVCGTKDKDTGKWKIEETSIHLASGQHDLMFIKITGRLQVDLYNFYRKTENFNSYKLDSVAGYLIGDFSKKIEINEDENTSTIVTSNITGLLVGSYIHIEEIGNTIDYYDNGAKFVVTEIDKPNHTFTINGLITPDSAKKIRWCLAKDDLTPKDIFRMTNGTADDRAVVAKYCIQDCNLVHYLFNKSDVLTGFIEMSKISSVPINFLVMRGQGIKLQSLIASECRKARTLIPVIEKGELDEGYEGAKVLVPKCDIYTDNPVACNDYASLYPSAMISENLSHDSKVWTKEYDLAGNLIEEWGTKNEEGEYMYDNLPEYEYVNVPYDTYKYFRKHPKAAAEKIKCGHKICRYAQFPEGESGIMPAILKKLLKARKDTRKMIPNQTDEFMKQVLEQRQLGYKVTANSLYGGCGAKTSSFYEKDIAACTTAIGRNLLTYGKRIIEECYGNKICNTANHGMVLTKAEYIYGDSVANYTPIYVKHNDIHYIMSIEELAKKHGDNKWVLLTETGKQDKEFCELDNVATWTENGWTKLHRVIRHELSNNKKMVRILTHTGLVDVTDDHSLLNLDGSEISPKDINIGNELLHHSLPINEEMVGEISIDEAQIMGFFFGDGSCGTYICPSGNKSSWALNNASEELIDKYLNLCKKVYIEYEWVVMPTLESSGVFKISPRNNTRGKIIEFVKYYRDLLYYDKHKIIPTQILNGSKEIKSAFFNGMYDADGDKDVNGYTRIDQKSQISASNICLLGQSLGYLTSLNIRSDKPDIYRVTMTKKTQRKKPFAIKKMLEMPYTGYVYDLTTENHHFAAGIGNLVVHNTDSVFYTFNLQTPTGEPIRGKKALEITIELAQEVGKIAAKYLKSPHDFEYEKTFMPFCLLSKKRYVGMLYELDANKCKRKEMGIVLKRRDNAPIVKDVYGGIIDILMKKQCIPTAIAFLKNCLQKVVDEQYPMDKLIISKSLRSGYKNPKSIAHKVLADRITARDPGNKPSSGDRISFAYIVVPGKKLQGEKIETPAFITENKLKIDYSFYITNQIMKPVQQLFALVIEKIWLLQNKRPKLLKYKKDVEALKKKYPGDDEQSQEKFQDKLEDLRCKEIKILMFDEYLRETNNEKAGNQSVTKFFTKS